ncbi:MAG: GAF domain-containing protein, partial [Bacteroidota bacterium]
MTPAPERGHLLGSLASLAFAAQSAFDTRGLVAALSQHVLEIARADGFALFLVDYETGDLDGDLFERGERGPVGHARFAPRTNVFLERVLRRETMVVDGPETPEAGAVPAGEPAGVPWPRPCACTVGLPLLAGTSLLGVAALGYRRAVPLTDRRRRALFFLAGQIGLALERLRALAEIEEKARQLEEARAALRRVDEAKSDLI